MINCRYHNIAPYLIVFFIATLFFALALIYPYEITSDVAFQIKSIQQYLRGETKLLNTLVLPDPKDLSKDSRCWITWWPPGVTIFFLPLIAMGLPLGFAARLTAYLLFLLGSLGWIKLADKIQAGFLTKLILSFVLPIYSLTIASVTSLKGDVLPFGIMPWLFLYTLYFCYSIDSGRKKYSYIIVHSCLLGILLGLVCWLKYSAFIGSLGILLYLLLYLLFFSPYHLFRIRLLLSGVYIFCLLLPVFTLILITKHLAGISIPLGELRNYAPLLNWSVKGTDPFYCFLGSPGLLLFQTEGWLTHLIYFSDRISPLFSSLSYYQKAVPLAITGIPGTMVFLWLFLYSRKIFSKTIFLFASCITFIPFILLLCLSIISWTNSFIDINRHIAPSFIFAEILLIASFCHLMSKIKRNIVRAFLLFIFILFFLVPNTFHLVDFVKNGLLERIGSHYVVTENRIFVPYLSKTNVKSVVGKINSLVKSPKDVVILSAIDGSGTSFVSWLEIKQRSLPLGYFWLPLVQTHGVDGTNIMSSKPFITSQKLRVILVISKSLEKDGKTLSRIKQRIPQAKNWFSLADSMNSDALVSIWYTDLDEKLPLS